jgi:putative phage-type endonuclease
MDNKDADNNNVTDDKNIFNIITENVYETNERSIYHYFEDDIKIDIILESSSNDKDNEQIKNKINELDHIIKFENDIQEDHSDYDNYSDKESESDSSDGFIFSEQDRGYILENAFNITNDIIIQNPLIYMYPDYKERIIYQVYDILEEQIIHLYELNNIENDLLNVIDESFERIHKFLLPIRSYNKTFVRKHKYKYLSKENFNWRISTKLNHINSKPQPQQKTDEWYENRHKLLTASNLWKIFSSESTKNQLIYEKCKPYDPKKYNFVSTESTLHWGNKYEPISVMFYEKHYATKVADYGCLIHDKYHYLAASPDGIVINPDSKRYGRMLEIKNIVNREINGIPKMEYWIQMQIQMEVCNLNECDFLETRFIEYPDEDAFYNDSDGTFSRTKDHDLKGIIIYFTINEKPFYEYAPLEISEKAFENWQSNIMEKHKNATWIKNIYWKLDEFSCILVLRNKLWFKHALPEIEKIWNIIQIEKENGYAHRAPKKRERKEKVKVIKKDSENESQEMEIGIGILHGTGTCLIDVNLLE